MRKILWPVAASIMVVFLVGQVAVAQNAANEPSAASGPASPVDGIISEGEYPNSAVFGDGAYEIYWRSENGVITFGMRAKTTGWVAVGFDPEDKMLNADIVEGWVDSDGKAFISDMFANAAVGRHPEDTSLGGKNDILAFAGTEKEGVTTIEFSRKLDTGDEYDKVLHLQGDTKIIWAFGPNRPEHDDACSAGRRYCNSWR